MISPAAAGMIFQLVYNPEYGPLNYLLSLIFGEIGRNMDWLGSSKLAVYSLIIVEIWQNIPFVTLVVLAGLTSISPELYESARIDSASSWQILWYITMPLIKMPIVVCVLIRTIDLLKFFDLSYILTRGGPGRSTETISFYGFNELLRSFRIGYATAVALFLLILVTCVVALLMRLIYRDENT